MKIGARDPDDCFVPAMPLADGTHVIERTTTDAGTLTVRFVAEPDSQGPPGEVPNVVGTGGSADPGPAGMSFEARWSEPDDTASPAVPEPTVVAAMFRVAVLRTKEQAKPPPGPA